MIKYLIGSLKHMIKPWIIKKVCPDYYNLKKLSQKKIFNGLNDIYGHKDSICSGTSEVKGDVAPWITYPAYEYINSLKLEGLSAFEWGSGNSSVFFSKTKNMKVTSVEHDPDWYESTKKLENSNLKVYLESLSDYHLAIEKYATNKKFDLIIIDGQRRFECVEYSVKFLNKTGMIILDNSDWFDVSSQFLSSQGLIRIDFHGFGPINRYTSTTSIFFQKDFFPIFVNKSNYSMGARHLREYDIIKDDDSNFFTKNLDKIASIIR